MRTLRILAGSAAVLGLVSCGANTESPAGNTETNAAQSQLHPKLENVSAGAYSLERNHAFLSFRVGHGQGISQYRIALTDFDASLVFDPADPEAAALSVTVNPMATETNYPADYKAAHADSVYDSWNEDVSRDPKWLNADTHPEITFISTGVQRRGDDTGTVTGNLTFLGQTKPITLDVIYNGSANAPWFGERDLIGFEATTSLIRSEWGMDAYMPLIGDTVTISFSGEFLQDE